MTGTEIIISILLGLLIAEIAGLSAWLSDFFLRSACCMLPLEYRSDYYEMWSSDRAADCGPLSRLLYSLGTIRAALYLGRELKQQKIVATSLEKEKIELRDIGASVAFFKAISNERRLMIMCALCEGEKSVGELEHIVGIGQPALSQHLARLRKENLVKIRRDKLNNIFYSIENDKEAIVGDCIRPLKGLRAAEQNRKK